MIILKKGNIRIIKQKRNNKMKFYNINIEFDPKITGRRNGSFAVEIRKKSFENDKHREYFDSFFDSNRKDMKGVRIETFQQFNLEKCPSATYFPMTKSIKKLDFMYYAPSELGIDFLVSERVESIISEYNLPIHNKIPVRIDTFDEKYFLLGFPIWGLKVLDFHKSTFFHRDKDVFSFQDYEDYENSDSKYRYATRVNLYLKEEIKYDVIPIGGAIFFLDDIVEKFKENGITGYRIVDGVLNIG